MSKREQLSRREREIMDIVYSRGEATVNEVLKDMPDPLARATVRTMLRILDDKGHLKHTTRGREFIYKPVRPRRRAGQSAMKRLIDTFFDGSLTEAVAAHIVDATAKLDENELNRLAELIHQAKEKGNK